MSEAMERHDFVKRCMELATSGVSVIPMRQLVPDKKPAIQWSQYQTRAALPATVGRWYDENDWPGVAIVTGFDGVFCIDADADHDEGSSHGLWVMLVEMKCPGLLGRMVQERSRSGGLHYWARYPEVEKGKDLAFAEDGRVVLEYKGSRRLCVCAPTPGYEIISGDLTRLPTITREEHQALLDSSYAVNRRYDPSTKGGRHFDAKGKPGTDYAAKATFAEVLEVLRGSGWKVVQEIEAETVKLERPGKDERSTGGDLKVVDGVVLFYCYTSSARPFEAMTAYNAFQVRTMALYGDAQDAWAKSARDLARQGYGARSSGGGGDDDDDEAKPDQLQCADHFVEEMSDRWAFDADLGTWRQWRGTHWEPANEHEIRALRIAMARMINTYGRRGVNSQQQAISALALAADISDKDFQSREDGSAKRGIIAYANGTMDVATGVLRAAERKDNLTVCLPYAYETEGRFPRIQTFLEETIPDEGGRLSYACHLGLALVGDNTFHKALVLVGGKNSGKSTLYKLSNMVCGNDRESGPSGNIFSNDLEGTRSRAYWNHKLLVAIDELPANALKHEDITKAMLAHTGVSMRKLNQGEELVNAWRPKVVFTANEDPRTTDSTGALGRRLLYISCPNAREDADPHLDRNLIDKLGAELGSFSAHCLHLAGEAISRGQYPESAASAAYGNRVELESDSLKAFITYNCIFEPDAFVSTETLYQHYIGYCVQNGHTGQLSLIRMVRRVMDRFGRQHGLAQRTQVPEGKVLRARGLVGIRLRTANDAPGGDD